MAKATSKTTPKRTPRKGVTAPKQSVAGLVTQQMKSDPIFGAIDAYDRARGAVLVMPDNLSDSKRQRFFDTLTKVEYRVAETHPTTLRGLSASSRWFCRFVAEHEGLENISGHHAVETWPTTIRDAIKHLWTGTDPAHRAIQSHNYAKRIFNEADEKADKAAHDKAEREWSEAETRMMQTAPTTPFGIAEALDTLLDHWATYFDPEDAPDVQDWLRLLSAAARALS